MTDAPRSASLADPSFEGLACGCPTIPSPSLAPGQKAISLALQGGGSHGAFTWGVLDRLLEDERIVIDGISGTSAGAMNGALLAYGLAKGGRSTAKTVLADFWRDIAHAALFSPLQPTLVDRMFGNPNLDHAPGYAAFELLQRVFSPYQLSPGRFHPMRRLLEESIDFKLLRAAAAPRLFVSATNVRTGRLRVFTQSEMQADCLLASACLPFLFKAIEIDGEAYWDGGYMGNPTLYPLVNLCSATDVVLVQINPISRPDVPTSSNAILDRLNEISFNATMLRELGALALINRLIGEGQLNPAAAGLKALRVHSVADDASLAAYSVSSKLNADWEFLQLLRRKGWEAAERWITTDFPHVGERSTFALRDIETTPQVGPLAPAGGSHAQAEAAA